MKQAKWVVTVFLAGVVALAGCHKAKAPPPAPVAFNAHVDLAKLQETLSTNTDAEVQACLTRIASGLRYGYDFEAVMVELDKLNQNTSLTEPQKKVIGEVIEQVKQVINQPKPGQ